MLIALQRFSITDALDNFDYRMVFPGRLRNGGSFVVCGGDIRKQVACVLVADDFEVGQRKKQRLADAKSGKASGIIESFMPGHFLRVLPPRAYGNTAPMCLIHIGQNKDSEKYYNLVKATLHPNCRSRRTMSPQGLAFPTRRTWRRLSIAVTCFA